MNMKHKQVRQGTYETNSSSTHAYTINTYRKSVKAEYKPIVDGPIVISPDAGEGDHWTTRVSWLVGYLYLSNRKDEVGIVAKSLSDFVGESVGFSMDKFIEHVEKYDTTVEDYFEIFNDEGEHGERGYGNNLKELIVFFDGVMESPESIRNFICSSGWVEVNEYYDG